MLDPYGCEKIDIFKSTFKRQSFVQTQILWPQFRKCRYTFCISTFQSSVCRISLRILKIYCGILARQEILGIFVSFYEHFHDIKPVLVNVYLVKKHVLAKCDNEIFCQCNFFYCSFNDWVIWIYVMICIMILWFWSFNVEFIPSKSFS